GSSSRSAGDRVEGRHSPGLHVLTGLAGRNQMPLKLNVGASRKVTDNNYGSRGASMNLELELDASLVADPPKLQERIRELFGLVRASLAEELNGHGAVNDSDPEEPPTNGHPATRPHSAADATRAVAVPEIAEDGIRERT